MERYPTFPIVVTAPLFKAIANGRSKEDVLGIAEEILLFACPICGHTTMDHRWIGPSTCLKVPCPCPGYDFDSSTNTDEEDLRTDIQVLHDEVLREVVS